MSEQQQNDQPVFSIEKLYVKDLSVEVPGAPQIFQEREAPQVEVSMNNAGKAISDGYYEVVINLTVTAKVKEKTMFLVEVAYGGVFQVRNVPESEIDMVMGVTCPNILFPYLREVVSETVSRAGFPPVILHPMNFEAIFKARQQKGDEQAAAGATTH
ncbi:MAG TPA: protein-export chaperone SecB [Burkholderiales bacterium]|nr:protein-export chaperone SecB [Burkholderiales bacterium]